MQADDDRHERAEPDERASDEARDRRTEEPRRDRDDRWADFEGDRSGTFRIPRL